MTYYKKKTTIIYIFLNTTFLIYTYIYNLPYTWIHLNYHVRELYNINPIFIMFESNLNIFLKYLKNVKSFFLQLFEIQIVINKRILKMLSIVLGILFKSVFYNTD